MPIAIARQWIRRLLFGALMMTSALISDSVYSQALGDSVIRRACEVSAIEITTTSRLAGAVHSLRWNGKEFIDSHDHGRQIQSASSFDLGMDGEFWAERYNPTEAGSRLDGTENVTTSQLLHFHASDSSVDTHNRMAFWLAPGEESFGRPALNTTKLSNHYLHKKIQIGFEKWSNVIEFNVRFSVPSSEKHTFAQFEALTGYMPEEFDSFWYWSPDEGQWKPLDDGPGEQPHPVVMSTSSGGHALGIYSPNQPSPGFESAGYGRFRFQKEKVVKWNCVFRYRHPTAIPSGDFPFQLLVAIGTLRDVEITIRELMARKA